MSFEEWLQSRLTAHGFPCGPIDGVIGPLTLAALRAFQEGQVGLKVTGTATEDTVTALRQPASLSAETRVTIEDNNNIWPRQSGVPGYYGPVGTGQVLMPLPYPMVLAWDKGVTISRISIHGKVADSASRAFSMIAAEYSNPEIRRAVGLDIFGGCLNVRRMRGGSSYSMHSWGIAIDFDPERNRLNWGRDKARLARPDAEAFWRIWEEEGWVSLGRARNYDWMHVQAARI